MANKRNNNIDIESVDIVCVDTKIKLSDEKLKNVLSKTYERARKDSRKFAFHNHYGVLFSISFTLLIALLTADILPLANISEKIIETIFWVVCVSTFIGGFILLLIHVYKKDDSMIEERDNAINEIMDDFKNR